MNKFPRIQEIIILKNIYTQTLLYIVKLRSHISFLTYILMFQPAHFRGGKADS